MIEIHNNNIIYTKEIIQIEIYEPSIIDKLRINDEIVLKIIDDEICGFNSNNNKLFSIDNLIDKSLIKNYLNNSRYSIKCNIFKIDFESETLLINIHIKRNIDLVNDPFVIRKDFNLIKTTNKGCNGTLRQFNYKYVKSGDILNYKFNGIVSIGFSELGELNTKAMEFIDENKNNEIIITYKATNRTITNNYVGVICINVILKKGKNTYEKM